MGMSRITDRPTPEWERQQGGNVVWSGLGRGEEPHLKVLFYCPFDVLLDMDADEFSKYEYALGRFRSMYYAHLVAVGANAGRLGDKGGFLGLDIDPATAYSALLRMARMPQVKTLQMLVEPFEGGMEQVRQTRPFLYALTHDISRALVKLEESLQRMEQGDYARPQKPLASGAYF
jgi:hypothetical protein